eukprot:TRINITY_DN218_c1_g1_i1.p1 TRINITY_DN218_c1_g1~~TRINITY_DN218_c1_g1_i1.p1  ORF type:complete len:400 (+),score=54.36 TRINITY_DN218_c1_g1_i1:543-1742(+)
MEENHQAPSRLGLKHTAGEIVEVQGGHIVRSTGRKDRHSKVCTAKGPRDRRVRLSAHTAIQFYDVQDRLGYDRPSKAVDWLIKKAKAAIDELAELPAWQPTATSVPQSDQDNHHHHHHHHQDEPDSAIGSSKKPMVAADQPTYGFHHHHMNNPSGGGGGGSSSSFLPPSLDTDSIADTIKSFFPISASSSSINFPNYPPDLLSRTSSHTQDLRLSLQSFQDPILLHHHHSTPSAHQALYSGSASMPFDPSSTTPSWSEQQQQQQQNQNQPEMARFQRTVLWNPADAGSGGGGYVFNTPPQVSLQPFLGQNHPFFTQRGPLQSSNSPSVRAWTDPPPIAAADHHQTAMMLHPSQPSISAAIGFASGGFSGFRVPARIQGEEEQDDAVDNKPSSASSASRH